MDPTTSSTDAPPAEPTSLPHKSWREAVLTSTPIVLTVVATALAGLSSSEMTLAQYHRSLAAQNQSKASDQWGFFQAKRIRGAEMELAADFIPARFKPGKVDANLLQTAVSRLVSELRRGEKDARRLVQGLGQSSSPQGGQSSDRGKEGDSLKPVVAELEKVAKYAAEQAEKSARELAQQLQREEAQQAFAYLSDAKVPEVQDANFDNPDLDKAVQAISDRLGEAGMGPLLRTIKEEDLNQAIEIAEANARRFENAGKPIGKTLDDLDKWVNRMVSQAASFHQAVRAWAAASADGSDKVEKAVSQMDRADSAVQAAAEELNGLFKAARYGYTSRRQGREAGYNLRTAGLYEVQVRLNSLNSGRHRTRSKLFFFGMLAAQAGVTIASLSLAVRQRNVLWGLAGLAGIGAVLFSGYVYLYM